MRCDLFYLLLICIISHSVLCTEKTEMKTRRAVVKENCNPVVSAANQYGGASDESDRGAWGSDGESSDGCGGDHSGGSGDNCGGDGRSDSTNRNKGPPCKGAAELFGKGSPKEKATSIAQKAAQEATSANEAQVPAAEAAAQQVKLQLAEKAVQSARAAEAALAGKQQIVEQLEQEKRETEAVVREVLASLERSQKSAGIAAQVVAEARKQLNDLKNIVKAIACTLSHIEKIASESNPETGEKAARKRLQCITKQLEAAIQDFERTKQAAYKAACAAVEAKHKASAMRQVRAPKSFSITDLYGLYRHPHYKKRRSLPW